MLSDFAPWLAAWLVSVPLIIFNLVLHIAGLSGINTHLVPLLQKQAHLARHRRRGMVWTMSLILTAVTTLHGLEGLLWAFFYRLMRAFPDSKDAMLYSIGAITTYGHAALYLAPHWQMMGALEALNGTILFGLTTAFLFSTLQAARLFRGD